MIWMYSFIDYLSLNHIVLSSLIHNLIIFHCPLTDLNTISFSFLGSTILPPAAHLCKECREVSMSFLLRISQTQSMFFFFWQIFLILESTLTFQRYVYSKSSLLKWNQRCLSWKDLLKIKLFAQRLNTCYPKYTVSWL